MAVPLTEKGTVTVWLVAALSCAVTKSVPTPSVSLCVVVVNCTLGVGVGVGVAVGVGVGVLGGSKVPLMQLLIFDIVVSISAIFSLMPAFLLGFAVASLSFSAALLLFNVERTLVLLTVQYPDAQVFFNNGLALPSVTQMYFESMGVIVSEKTSEANIHTHTATRVAIIFCVVLLPIAFIKPSD